MKILFFYNSLAMKAGIERTLTDKANYLAEHGHDVSFVTYEQGKHSISFPLFHTIKHVDLDCRAFSLFRFSLVRRMYETIKLKRKFVKKWKSVVFQINPDIIVTTTNSAVFIPELMSVHSQFPIIIESHVAYTVQKGNNSFLKSMLWKHRLSVYRKCSLFVALTEGDAACWRKHLHQVCKVDNPVTCYINDPFKAKRVAGRIISVGRMNNTQKRFDRLIDAFAAISSKYPNWHVDIFGEGNLQNTLEQQIERLGLKDKIIIHQPSSNIYDEYLCSELYVMSSDYEGFGLVLVEAMACGVPVISTDCPFGPSEIIEDGVTGLLAKMDVDDLANKIEWMITHPKKLKSMGVKAHESAAKYQLENVMPKWEAVYKSVLR